MEKLNKQLWAVVREYTHQTAELMGAAMKDVYWIGTCDRDDAPVSLCDMGDTLFLSLEEMQVIIDRLPEWMERFAPGKPKDVQREAVAQEVREWAEWVTEEDNHVDGHPRINLEHWLMGCPREPRKPTEYDQLLDGIRQNEADIATVARLIDTRHQNFELAYYLGLVLEDLQKEGKRLQHRRYEFERKMEEELAQVPGIQRLREELQAAADAEQEGGHHDQ